MIWFRVLPSEMITNRDLVVNSRGNPWRPGSCTV